MKKFKTVLLASALILSANSSFAESKKYSFEQNHSSVSWSANHFGFSNPSGKFTAIEGVINFDEAAPEKSSVDATIKIASLSTGLEKFDQHLKSADFFNLDKFQTAKFVSKKVKVVGKNSAKIEGDLTLVGVTKPVVLDVKFNRSAVNPINQKPTVGFSATATLKRSEFGINYAIPGVSDEVKLVIEVEAN
jgi:polyisoprenoid-binding protein YceI